MAKGYISLLAFWMGTGGSTVSVPTLSLSPSRVRKGAATLVTFVGFGTDWTGSAPTFAATGAPTDDPAWSVGAVTVLDASHATALVTVGATGGDATFTDSTTGATAVLGVGQVPPIVMLRPAPTRWYGRGR